LKARSLRKAYSFAPHLIQNAEPGALAVPQLVQWTGAGALVSAEAAGAAGDAGDVEGSAGGTGGVNPRF
jgi:hypothetical protein